MVNEISINQPPPEGAQFQVHNAKKNGDLLGVKCDMAIFQPIEKSLFNFVNLFILSDAFHFLKEKIKKIFWTKELKHPN